MDINISVFCGCWCVYLHQDLSVQQHPEGPGVQVLLLVRGSRELQQHQGYPKQQHGQTGEHHTRLTVLCLRLGVLPLL